MGITGKWQIEELKPYTPGFAPERGQSLLLLCLPPRRAGLADTFPRAEIPRGERRGRGPEAQCFTLESCLKHLSETFESFS